MRKKQLLFLLLLFQPLLFLYSVEIVYTFEPLGANERLVYQMDDYNTLYLYAQDIESLYVTRFIGSWTDSVEWGMLQFSDNRRDCFFTIESYSSSTTLYMLRGDEGTIVGLFENIARGRFNAFINRQEYWRNQMTAS